MESFIDIYAEYGAMGLVVLAFFYSYLRQSQRADEQADALEELSVESRGQSHHIENIESILLKMLDRWNISDSTRDRRHLDMVKEVNDLSDVIMEVKGSVSRINGKN